MRALYKVLSHLVQARANCLEHPTTHGEWAQKHEARIKALVHEHMPSGSGVDNGTKLDPDSTPERLVFTFSYHHMNDIGMYDGWTEHTCIVTPSLASGIHLRITGRDRNDTKEYLYEIFRTALETEVE